MKRLFMMKGGQVQIGILAFLVLQLASVQSQCTIDKQVLQVKLPTTAASTCSDTSVKKYELAFDDSSVDLTYTISNGVYLIDTAKRGATLKAIINPTTTKEYTLAQIQVRGMPMYTVGKAYYSMELQMYFVGQSDSDNIAYSLFYETTNTKPLSSSSQFFLQMDPTIINDKQNVNLKDSLQYDMRNMTDVYESTGIIYKQKTYTWLFATQYIQVNQRHFEMFRNAWSDPYVLQQYDNINISEGTCTLAQSSIYALCMNGSAIIGPLVSIILFLIL